MRDNRSSSSLIFGGLLFVAGAVWFLNEIGINLSLPDWMTRWPMILNVIGFALLFNMKNRLTGGILLSLGILFTIKHEFNLNFNIWTIALPLILMIAGGAILIQYLKPVRKQENVTDSDDFINDFSLMSGSKRIIKSQNFGGGKISAIWGGSEINLLEASASPNAVIDVFVLMGGGKIIVPADWTIIVQTTNVMGGIEEKRKNTLVRPNPEKSLTIKGVVVMGGFEIVSY